MTLTWLSQQIFCIESQAGDDQIDSAEFTSTAQKFSSYSERKSSRKRRATSSAHRTRPKPPPIWREEDDAAIAEVPVVERHVPINRSDSATAAALLNMSNDTATGSSLMEAMPSIESGGGYGGYDTGLFFLEDTPPEHGVAEFPSPVAAQLVGVNAATAVRNHTVGGMGHGRRLPSLLKGKSPRRGRCNSG